MAVLSQVTIFGWLAVKLETKRLIPVTKELSEGLASPEGAPHPESRSTPAITAADADAKMIRERVF